MRNYHLLIVLSVLLIILLVSVITLNDTKPVLTPPQAKCNHKGKFTPVKFQIKKKLQIAKPRQRNCSFHSCVMTLYEWQHTVMPPSEFIIGTSSQNEQDDWLPFPVGFNWRLSQVDKEAALLQEIQKGPHNKILHVALSSHRDKFRKRCKDNRNKGRKTNRKEVLEHLEKNGFKNNIWAIWDYYGNLTHYKFVASPEGNGIDCHRHYEALVAGCIIIVEKYHQNIMNKKYGDVPMLFTDNYSEITTQYLIEQYSRMINQTYNFSHLFFSHWSVGEQVQMKKNSIYWQSKRCSGECHPWYTNRTQPSASLTKWVAGLLSKNN